ncbi:hypothetical protein [Alteromonas sp. C1M14]|uniref:hypothetical protein n=1 Tax=Alteromonas sp. C1M14 TaxID=2841567 RepID=UPI001C0A0010|nr:hypothetical protein [Alteromonas sp. C1M14]MBU2977268.1 hypothetical protein [Alteromonas sp. C1M14]
MLFVVHRFLRNVWWVACLSLLSVGVRAEGTVVATLLGKPIYENAVMPSAEQLNMVARTLGVSKEMAVAHFKHAKLSDIIIEGVLDDYAKQHNIEPDPALVTRFIDVFGESLKSAATLPQEPEQESEKDKAEVDNLVSATPPTEKRDPQTVAQEQIKLWLINKALYAQYGGAVVFRSNTPQFPIAAYNALFKDYAAQGKLVIKEESFAGLFWRSFAPPYNAEIDPEFVDFSHPWWF